LPPAIELLWWIAAIDTTRKKGMLMIELLWWIAASESYKNVLWWIAAIDTMKKMFYLNDRTAVVDCGQ
jgi:hypothetical protein